MTNTGKVYEKFVESIYQALTSEDKFTSVEYDVYLDGKDGPRQIDILLRSKVANIDLLTIIECRDIKRHLNITHVDGFHSKINDVNASKGVLVSRKGFSKKAKQKASRVGITLCLASDVRSVLKEIKREIPVKCRHVIIHFKAEFSIKGGEVGATFDMNEVVKELGIFDDIYRKIINGDINISTGNQNIQLHSSELKLPYIIKNSEGNIINIINGYKISLIITVDHYYGHLEDIQNLTSIHQYDNDSTSFIFKSDDYPNLLPSLSKFATEKDIPQNYRLTFNVLDVKFKSLMAEPPLKNLPQIITYKHLDN